MITVTFTFKHTSHQAVLIYKTKASQQAAERNALESSVDGCITMGDDFGQRLQYMFNDVASVVVRDLSEFAAAENLLGIAEAERDQEFQKMLQQRPDLKFLVGKPNPPFDRR